MPRHNLTVSAVFQLPWTIQLAVLSTFQSSPPIAPTINGFSNSGTDVSSGGYTPLLGILGKGYSGFIGKEELASLVNEYNTQFAGTLTPAGAAGVVANQRYPVIQLPADGRLRPERCLQRAGPAGVESYPVVDTICSCSSWRRSSTCSTCRT